MTSDAAGDPRPQHPTAGPAPVRTGESVAGTTRAEAVIAYRPAPPQQQAPEPDTGVSRRNYLQQVIHDSLRPIGARVGLAWVGILMFLACFAPFLANSHPILYKPRGGGWSSPMLGSIEPADVALPVAFVTAAVLLVRRRLSVGAGLALTLWTASLTFAVATIHLVKDHWRALRWESYGRELLSVPSAAAILGIFGLMLLAALVLPPLRWVPFRATVRATAALAPLLVLLAIFPLRPQSNIVYQQYRVAERRGEVETVVRTIVPYSARDRQRDDPEARLQPPNPRNWAGTDNYAADLLSRMIHACRIALAIGFIATGISVVLGILVGGLMGYFAGWADLLGMRLIEILEAIPTLVLLIAITAAWGRNIYLMMAVIGLIRWTGNARFIRAEFLKLRKQDFVQAAIATGLPLRSILFRHMLPNGVSPVLVSASFGVASAILLESTLSFLGLGLIDDPSWGEMLAQARTGGSGFNWWIATFPGLLIFLTVFSYNLVGEAIRDALDPKLLKRE